MGSRLTGGRKDRVSDITQMMEVKKLKQTSISRKQKNPFDRYG